MVPPVDVKLKKLLLVPAVTVVPDPLKVTVPAVGFIGRSQRYSMIIENGVITSLNEEIERTTCDISGGETILDQL